MLPEKEGVFFEAGVCVGWLSREIELVQSVPVGRSIGYQKIGNSWIWNVLRILGGVVFSGPFPKKSATKE